MRASKVQTKRVVMHLQPGDSTRLLMLLAVLSDDKPRRLLRWDKDPKIFLAPPDAAAVARFCAGGPADLPIITVTLATLHRQRFIVCMGEYSASTVEAARLLGVPPTISLDSCVLCAPDEFSLHAVGDLWQLRQRNRYVAQFGSDDLAQAMLAVGVRAAK